MSILTSNDHRERVLKTERLGYFEIETRRIALLDAVIDFAWIAAGGFVKYGRERGPGVFDVEIEITCEESFLAEKRTAEIGFAFDMHAGARFDVLREELRQDNLLGEEF